MVANVLRELSREDALRLIALAQASNDLILNVEALEKFSESENLYFFVSSLSILRELAKLVASFDETGFEGKLSKETIGFLGELKACLASFESGSLVKGTLKPIRDVTFHYNHVGEKGKVKNLVDQAISLLESQDALEIGFLEGIESPNGQRYFFAEEFRSSILNQLLRKR